MCVCVCVCVSVCECECVCVCDFNCDFILLEPCFNQLCVGESF